MAKKLYFTDGTYVTLLEASDNLTSVSEIRTAYIINACCVIGSSTITNFTLDSGINVTKTDTNGNTWIFGRDTDGLPFIGVNTGTVKAPYSNGVVIFYYNSEDNTIRWTVPTRGMYEVPYYIKGNGTINGITYNQTAFSSTFTFTDAIAEMQNNPTYSSGISNIYNLTTDTIITSIYTFYTRNCGQNKSDALGSYFSESRLIRFAWNAGSGGTVSGTFTVEDYDPNDPFLGVDPYDPGGDSDSSSRGEPSSTSGGTGDFDGTSDTIAVPSLPSTEITDSGFLTLFVTSQSGLRNLANELWSNVFSAIMPGGSLETTVTALKNVVSSPYDAILGCSIVPVNVSTSGSKNVKMYGVIDCGVSMSVAASQYATVDCGTLNINEFWGAYLDYSPYTKVTSLYLPYVGVVSVDVDQIMGKALQVVYHVDILSGQCVAYIVIDGSVEFQYQGHCSTPIPITSVDYSSTIQAGLGLVGSVANIAGSAIAGAAGGAAGVIAAAGGALASAVPSMAGDVMNAKPDIKSGSGIGGMGGIMSVQKPFLIIERPRQSKPTSQNHYTGYPSNVNATLGNLSGYTEVSRVFIKGMSATEEEQKEIESLLYKGVIL